MSEPQTPPVGTEPEQTTPPVTPEAGQETETPQAPLVETPTVTTEGKEETPVTPQPQAPDYKDKFVASQREAIVAAERVNVANARIEQLTKTDTPTDEAMRQLYPEWDQLNEITKTTLIRQETLAMQQVQTLAKQQEIDARQKLEDQLDDVIDNSEHAPKLKGRENEFKRFARNPKNRGIAADTLAKAFLFDVEEPSNPTPMIEALPAGSGGPREPLTQKKIPIEEAAEIRKTDYKRYKQLLDSNMIEEI
jgi:hypothetical protein